MVRRFRHTTLYPSGFSSKLGDDQSSVPSQHSPVEPAFDPGHQPDMIPTPIVGTPDVSIVRATFDSRFPFTYDWFVELAWFNGFPLIPPYGPVDGYVVPQGWVAIIRKISIKVLQSGLAPGPFSVLNAYGSFDPLSGIAIPTLQILIDDVPTTNFTVGRVALADIFFSEIEIPCFILVKGGAEIDISLSGITSPENAPATTGWDTYIHLYGNMMLSTGRNIVNEVGNQYPQPVIDVNPQSGS